MLYQLRFDLTTPAVDDRPVYVTGNFCDWVTDLAEAQLQPTGPGTYSVTIQLDESLPELVEYKYYRGGEGSLELNEDGEVIPNRTVNREAGVAHDYVPYWQWNGQAIDPTYLPIEQTLYLTYPGKAEERRVQVLLPYDYADSDRHYPVLYLNDGQNLVGEGEGYGSWQTEIRMAQLATRQQHNVIIVAIDHAGEERMREYTIEPFESEPGQGETYLDFVINTVKPHIDATYRTLPDAANTGMGGSSLGGLITAWAGLLRPDVFGKSMVFSPALWMSKGIYAAAAEKKLPHYAQVYLYGGGAESDYMVPDLTRLQENSHCEVPGCGYLHIEVDPEGQHEESRWSRQLPRAIAWLFFDRKAEGDELGVSNELASYPA